MMLMVNYYVSAWAEDDTLEIRIDQNNPDSFEGIIEVVAQPMIPISRKQAFNYQIKNYDDGSQGFTIDLGQFESGLFNLQASLLTKEGERQTINISDPVVLRSDFLSNFHFKIHSSNLQTDILLGEAEETIEEEVVEEEVEEVVIEEELITEEEIIVEEEIIEAEIIELEATTADAEILEIQDTIVEEAVIETIIIQEELIPTVEVLETTFNTEFPIPEEDLMVEGVTLNVNDKETEIAYQWQSRENTPDFYQKTYLQEVKSSDFWEEISLEESETYQENPESIEIGFNFNFYTDTFNSTLATKEGILLFGEPVTLEDPVEDPENWDRTESLISPFALSKKVEIDPTSVIRTDLIGEAPEQTRVIEWETTLTQTGEKLHMQAHLLESSDAIRFVYKSIPETLETKQTFLGVKNNKNHEQVLNDSELLLEKIQDLPVVIMRPGPRFADLENENLPVLEADKVKNNKTYRVIITPSAENHDSSTYTSRPITVRPENIHKKPKDEETSEEQETPTEEEVTEEETFDPTKFSFTKLQDFMFTMSFDGKLKRNRQDFLLYTEVSLPDFPTPILDNNQILLHFPQMKDKYSDYIIAPENLWIHVSRGTYENFTDENGDMYFLLPKQALESFTLYLNLPVDTPSGVFDIYGEIATS